MILRVTRQRALFSKGSKDVLNVPLRGFEHTRPGLASPAIKRGNGDAAALPV
jgi:hypothetical protein